MLNILLPRLFARPGEAAFSATVPMAMREAWPLTEPATLTPQEILGDFLLEEVQLSRAAMYAPTVPGALAPA